MKKIAVAARHVLLAMCLAASAPLGVHCATSAVVGEASRDTNPEAGLGGGPGLGGGDGILAKGDGSLPSPSATYSCENGGKGNIGCDFYSAFPLSYDAPTNATCFAAFIVNVSSSPVTIHVEQGGKSLDVPKMARIPSGSGRSITYAPLPNGQLPGGAIAILSLAEDATPPDAPGPPTKWHTCPSDPGFQGMPFSSPSTGIGSAFHITTSSPVVAYDMFPYGGGASAITSATLLLPTRTWGTNYLAAGPKPSAPSRSSIQLVAAEDGTEVTFAPTVPMVTGVASETGKGIAPSVVPRTYKLDRGELLHLWAKESDNQSTPYLGSNDLSGSRILSNKPIGVWNAVDCLTLPETKVGLCDTAHQQLPPIKAFGHEYVAVRYRDRFDGKEESPPWRIVGAVDGTKLTYEPAPPEGAPATLSTSQVADFRAPGPFSVRSQDENHPFYMAAMMTGCSEMNPTKDDCRGDPEFVNLIPPDQYMSNYIFFTDPTYPETNLVLVRKNTGQGFKDVVLDCAGSATGWQPLGTSGAYEYTRIDLVRHDFEPQGACNNGRHEIKSEAPFGLTVWGWGTAETGTERSLDPNGSAPYSQCVSYAYPAGAGVASINQVVVPPDIR
jgi:hypothetical protein